MTYSSITKTARPSRSGSTIEELPSDIVHLLQILARIEARRQAHLRAERMAGARMPAPTEGTSLVADECPLKTHQGGE